MELAEAIEKGITRLRIKQWGDPEAYFKIDLVGEGKIGPLIKLYDRGTQEVNGYETPQVFPNFGYDIGDGFEEYTGGLDKNDNDMEG